MTTLRLSLLVVLPTMALLASCATSTNELTSAAARSVTFGLTRDNPVEVCSVPGQRAYLANLRCSDGGVPQFRRVGNFGQRNPFPPGFTMEQQGALMEGLLRGAPPVLKPGESDYHIVDGYELTCGTRKTLVYMDMYHCGNSQSLPPPQGFSTVAR